MVPILFIILVVLYMKNFEDESRKEICSVTVTVVGKEDNDRNTIVLDSIEDETFIFENDRIYCVTEEYDTIFMIKIIYYNWFGNKLGYTWKYRNDLDGYGIDYMKGEYEL